MTTEDITTWSLDRCMEAIAGMTVPCSANEPHGFEDNPACPQSLCDSSGTVPRFPMLRKPCHHIRAGVTSENASYLKWPMNDIDYLSSLRYAEDEFESCNCEGLSYVPLVDLEGLLMAVGGTVTFASQETDTEWRCYMVGSRWQTIMMTGEIPFLALCRSVCTVYLEVAV